MNIEVINGSMSRLSLMVTKRILVYWCRLLSLLFFSQSLNLSLPVYLSFTFFYLLFSLLFLTTAPYTKIDKTEVINNSDKHCRIFFFALRRFEILGFLYIHRKYEKYMKNSFVHDLCSV